MRLVCRICAGHLDRGPCVFCSACLEVTSKLGRAVARVALRYDVAAPVTTEDLATIRATLAEAIAPFKLTPQVKLGRAGVQQIPVVELEAWELTPPRRRCYTTIIIK